MGNNSSQTDSQSSGKGAWLAFWTAILVAIVSLVGVIYSANTSREVALMPFWTTQTADARRTLIGSPITATLIPTVQSIIIPSPTGFASVAATYISSPVATQNALPSPTVVPGSTPNWTATANLLPRSTVPSATAISLPSLLPTRDLSTVTPAILLSPTATTPRYYPKVTLMVPEGGGSGTCPSCAAQQFTLYDTIEFGWKTAYSLPTTDNYRLQVARDVDFKVVACQAITKNTRITLQGGMCNGNWQFNNVYLWRVQVVSADGVDFANVLSVEPAQVGRFLWAP